MINKVWNFTKNNKMIEKGDRIVAGVSGGADSVCLLYVLRELCRKEEAELVAAHINHQIRGGEADSDEQYVRELCRGLGVKLFTFTSDVRGLAAQEGLSEEEAGRKARYQAFFEVCRLEKCNKIAVAHNKNDNAETFLFHLFRGTGVKGLTGILPLRTMNIGFGEVTVIRPLLCTERKEIEEFLYHEGISYRIDSTNLTDDYSRNKIRNKILTYAAAEINTQAVKNIDEASIKIREALEFIDQSIEKRYQDLVKEEEAVYRVPVNLLLAEPPVIQKGIIRQIEENLAGGLKNLEAKHTEEILSLCVRQVGKSVDLPYGIIAEREYDNLLLYMKSDDSREASQDVMEPVELRIPGRTEIKAVRKAAETEILPYEKNSSIPKNSCVKWFDYDKIENAVKIRGRQEGDYICINSSGGNKKLKDYFIDHKIPKKQRDSQILITDGSHVMWIPGAGDRISEKYKIDENTKRILLMKLIDLEDS